MVREEFEDKLVELVDEYINDGEDLEWDGNDECYIDCPYETNDNKKVDIEITFSKPYST